MHNDLRKATNLTRPRFRQDGPVGSQDRKCRLSGLSTLIKDHLAGGASRLAALLLPQILPVFSVVAPCHPGAALRDLVLVQRGQATSRLPPYRCGPAWQVVQKMRASHAFAQRL